MENQHYSQYDKIADVYDTLFVDEASLNENMEVGAMLSPLKGTILDIGCGTGLLAELLDIEPKMYTGIDPSSGMLERFLNKHESYIGRLYCMPFNKFLKELSLYENIISLFGSASYLEIDDLYRIVKPYSKKFLMFYNEDYYPVTYQKTNVKFQHNVYEKDFLKCIFSNSDVFNYDNYIIVSDF